MCSHDAGAYLWVGFLGEHGAWLALVDYFQTFGKLSFGILKKKIKTNRLCFSERFYSCSKIEKTVRRVPAARPPRGRRVPHPEPPPPARPRAAAGRGLARAHTLLGFP